MSTIQPLHRTFVDWLPPIGVLCGLALLAMGESTAAQDPPDEPSAGVIRQSTADDRAFDGVKITASKVTIDLTERFSKDLEFPERLLKVDGHDPDVVSVTALDPSRLRVRGLAQGVTTMVVTGASGQKYIVELYVGGDARLLQSVLKRAFPDSAIDCRALMGGNILLTGYVTDNQTISQIMDIARVYAPDVINHMRVGGPQEVQLRVKIMEVQRSKLRTFGINMQAMTKSAVIASTPGSITPVTGLINPIGGPPSVTMNPGTANPLSLTAAFSNDHFAFSMFIQALKEEGLLKVMSEPILVARSGEAARLSDGGEFPIPVPGGLGTVTIEFREFGVILETLPIVLSPTRVKQQVTAEISDKDTANSITLLGTTVPGITKRRVQSTVDMNFGDTMVVAGLISTRVTGTFQKTPFIGELPGVGAFFSKKVMQQSETELIILITPEFGSSLAPGQVPPGGPGMNTTVPTDRELYKHGLIEVPLYGPECGPDCQQPMSHRYQYGGSSGGYNGYSGGNNGSSSGPVISPTPIGRDACTPSSSGLISPPGMTPSSSSPVEPIQPPPPSDDKSASRKSPTGSPWPSKSRAIATSKSKEQLPSGKASAVQPAGYSKLQTSEKPTEKRQAAKNSETQ